MSEHGACSSGAKRAGCYSGDHPPLLEWSISLNVKMDLDQCEWIFLLKVEFDDLETAEGGTA